MTVSTSNCARPWSAHSTLPLTPRLSPPTESPNGTATPCTTQTLSCGIRPWCTRWRDTLRTARGSLSSCHPGAKPLAPLYLCYLHICCDLNLSPLSMEARMQLKAGLIYPILLHSPSPWIPIMKGLHNQGHLPNVQDFLQAANNGKTGQPQPVHSPQATRSMVTLISVSSLPSTTKILLGAGCLPTLLAPLQTHHLTATSYIVRGWSGTVSHNLSWLSYGLTPCSFCSR
jgi:hypothetical protein